MISSLSLVRRLLSIFSISIACSMPMVGHAQSNPARALQGLLTVLVAEHGGGINVLPNHVPERIMQARWAMREAERESMAHPRMTFNDDNRSRTTIFGVATLILVLMVGAVVMTFRRMLNINRFTLERL